MKQKTILTLMLMFALLVFPMASADVIIPTKTNVYFEQNGQAYNGNIEFTVKGYGYATGMPGDPDFNPDREPGTYAPEVVYSFSATYNNYGDEINENYYRNYVNIDYYELEGKTADGKTFIIKNIESIPTTCDDNYEERNCELRFNLDNATWSEAPEPQGFWSKIGCFFKRLFGGSC